MSSSSKKSKKAESEDLYGEDIIRWFESAPEDSELYETQNKTKTSKELANLQQELKQKGKALLEKLAVNTAQKRRKTADDRWVEKVIKSGTTIDKLAASMISIKQNPLSSLKPLEQLVAQAKKKGGKANVIIVDNLRDLFLFDLLPESRKLKYFREQPYSSPKVTSEHLLYWVFEEELKIRFVEFLGVLEIAAKDPIEHLRDVAVKSIFMLLNQRPEQEKALLTMLVNKLGDPHAKVASLAVTYLLNLLTEHPKMKFIVARDVECLIQRPNISEKSIYYGLIFLNQIILTKADSDVSVKLTEIYFYTFKKFIAASGQAETRLLSAILVGLNRAYPFVDASKRDLFESHTQLLYQLVHKTSLNKTTQVLMLLFQLHTSESSENIDRFYRVLYEQLFHPELPQTNKVSMFFNLLFRAINKDTSIPRIYAFIKRLLQACSLGKPSFICAGLFLISEVIKARPQLWACIQQPEDVDEDFQVVSNDETKSDQGKNFLYDPSKREPKYSGAENSCLWELGLFLSHYHPSVVVFARSLQNGEFIEYKGDPLLDFGLISFLDKFVYKNPRSRERLAGGSIMQSLRPRAPIVPLNSKQFLSKSENQIPEEDKFFYRYFNTKKEDQAEANLDAPSESEDDFDADAIAAEERALLGEDFGDDDEVEPDFGDEPPEFDINDLPDDDNDEYLEEPSEDELEAMLLQDEELLDEVEDFEEEGGESSAFAAAEEYAELLEAGEEIDEDKIKFYREKARLAKIKKKKAYNDSVKDSKPNSKSNSKANSKSNSKSKQILGKKRKTPPGPQKKQTKRKKKF